MSGFSFSATIHSKQFDYTVRTVNFDSIHRIVVNLQEHERVLSSRAVDYDPDLTDEKLMELVKRHHEERVVSLQELMKISAKLESKPDVDSNYKLGLVFLNSGLAKETIGEFKRALALDPENVPILNHLGLALLLEDKVSDALQVYERTVALKANYPDVHNNYGLALLRAERYEQALQEFEQALSLNNRYAEAHFNLALCLASQAAPAGRLAPAGREQLTAHLNQAAQLNPLFNNEYFKVAQNYLSKEQYTEARQALLESKTAVMSDAGSEVYHEFYLRLKYGEEGVDRKATEHYIAKLEEILEKHPNYVDIHNDLGVAYLIQCRFLFNRAINEFKRALAINPNYSQAKKNLKLSENEGKGFLILLRAILYF